MAFEDLYKVEELLPELKIYFNKSGMFEGVFHPLAYSYPHSKEQNRYINMFFKQKRYALEVAIVENNYSKIIYLHERPYRLNAFVEYILPQELTDKKYWSLLSDIWIDSENINQNMSIWDDLLFRSNRKSTNSMMTKEERTSLKLLPKYITVYRGVSNNYREGFSWTTDIEIARYFAYRFNKKGVVIQGTVDKKHVLAYFTGRNEREILVHYDDVKSIELIE